METIKISSEYLDEYESMDDLVDPWLKKLYIDYDKSIVVGSSGTWQGRREIIPQIIHGTDFNTFSEHLSTDIDTIEVEIFSSHYDVKASHHDGTNYYTIIPFSFEMLTSKFVDTIIHELDLKEDLNDYIINNTPNDGYVKKWYTATKETKVDFLENAELETLPSIGSDDFLKRYNIKF